MLAITVVYFLDDESIGILDLHLRFIARCTEGPFVVYGVAPRVSERVRRHLSDCPFVRLLDVERTALTGSREHSHYLNQLCDHALSQGATRICTMDVDAFPIAAGWNRRFDADLAAGDKLVSVFRAENGDTVLTHPSCCYFAADLWSRHRFEFLPPESTLNAGEFAAFLRRTKQKPDSGIGLAYLAWKEGWRWKRLLRSNRVDDHYLLAGIYGDAVFHLGAMSWTRRDFRGDRAALPTLRNLDRLAAMLKALGLFRGKAAALWNTVNDRASGPLMRRTAESYARIRRRLLEDADGYLAYLRGALDQAPSRPDSIANPAPSPHGAH